MNPISRRILLVTTGLSPQVVTETLYALACRGVDPWVPHEVHIVTTMAGKEHARLNLLGPNGWFVRLCADYHLPSIDFTVNNIHVLRTAQDVEMDDIRSPEQNAHAADFITDLVRKLTEDPNHELYVSIAGGRKTMGYYLGYALSLYGRPRDRLSHVLVSEPFEANRDFYYPTPYDHPIHTRRGEREWTVNAKDALIELADIPFVRLREGLPERLRKGQSSLSEVVMLANRGLDAAHMKLEVSNRKVWADEEALEVSDTEFVLLLWLALRVKQGVPLTDWSDQAMVVEFLDVAKQLFGSVSADYERLEDALEWRKDVAIRLSKYFEPHKSRINANLVEKMGGKAAKRYAIERLRLEDKALFRLPLEADQLEIEDATIRLNYPRG